MTSPYSLEHMPDGSCFIAAEQARAEKERRAVYNQIDDGDLLFFRPNRRWLSRLIARFGRSDYSHVGMASWLVDRWEPFCLHMREWRGGAIQPLEEVCRHNQIDVYRVLATDSDEDLASDAVGAMLDILHYPYGWWSLLRVALHYVPFVRLFVRAVLFDTNGNTWPFCSEAVSRAWRRAGIDLVPNLADRYTEPGDLARSSHLCFVTSLPRTKK